VDFKKTIYHKRYTKANNENFELYIVCIFKETKADFLFYKNFCVTFVPFVVFYLDSLLSGKNSRFFTSFRMTDYYILFVGDGVGWRLCRQPTPSHLPT